MTDARFPDHWMHDARIQELSGDHFRAFMHALAWCVTNRTDGFIRTSNLPLIHRVDDDAVAAFVAAGLLVELDGGWLITVYVTTQTSRAQFEANDRTRAKDRERKAKQRARESAAQTGVYPDVRHDLSADFSGRQAGRQATAKSNQEEKGGNSAENGYTPTAAQKARIEANVRTGYET